MSHRLLETSVRLTAYLLLVEYLYPLSCIDPHTRYIQFFCSVDAYNRE